MPVLSIENAAAGSSYPTTDGPTNGPVCGACAGQFPKVLESGLTMRIGMETKTPTVIDTKPVGPSMPSSSLFLCSVAISIYSLLTLYGDLFLSLSPLFLPESSSGDRT